VPLAPHWQVGVEIVSRTGRNPTFTYQSIGCSRAAATKMLNFATAICQGKPFSNVAMARSLIWPRTTDCSSFFCAGAAVAQGSDAPPPRRTPTRACAELVAKILQVGGLLDQNSNPGAATPAQLHALYKNRAAVSANPYVLRELTHSFAGQLSAAESVAERESLMRARALISSGAQVPSRTEQAQRSNSPSRRSFKPLQTTLIPFATRARPPVSGGEGGETVVLTMESLNFRKR